MMTNEYLSRYGYIAHDEIDNHTKQLPITVMVRFDTWEAQQETYRMIDELWPSEEYCDFGHAQLGDEAPFWFTNEEDAETFRRKVVEIKLSDSENLDVDI